LISLSPLPSAHPSCFQPTPVRTSIRCYPYFILAKGRSPRFASIPSDSHALFGLAFATARFRLTSPLRITSRLIMQKARGQAVRHCWRHRPPTACRHTVSGTLSLPSQGCFSPFPHGTGSLSVTNEYLALRDGPRSFPRDFTCPAVLRNLSTEPARFRLRDCHPLWSLFPGDSTNDLVAHSAALRPDRPYNPREHALWFGLLRVRSPLLAESLTCFLLLQVLRWFTSLRCLPHPYVFRMGYRNMTCGGFPHSDILGSTPACGSPGLIAACHVLHRLLVPRHSPYALSSLTKCFTYTLRVCDQRTTDCGVFSCQRFIRWTATSLPGAGCGGVRAQRTHSRTTNPSEDEQRGWVARSPVRRLVRRRRRVRYRIVKELGPTAFVPSKLDRASLIQPAW
jgi:hypothetical protein